MMTISVIVTTFNNPLMLTAVLTALSVQSDQAFELLIADDGSTQETAECLKQFTETLFPGLQHVWQEDRGFRAARIRNKAIAQATGDYIIFLDGDCLVRPNFIAHHRALARTGWFVAGNRVLLSADFTAEFLQAPTQFPPLTLKNTFIWWQQKKLNRWHTLWTLPLGLLRYALRNGWRGVKTCNLAVWKKDLLTINGFDERYQGWGYEDSDLVIRLLHAGIGHKSGRFATTVLHLWHPISDRSQAEDNLTQLRQLITSTVVCAEQGLDQYSAFFERPPSNRVKTILS